MQQLLLMLYVHGTGLALQILARSLRQAAASLFDLLFRAADGGGFNRVFALWVFDQGLHLSSVRGSAVPCAMRHLQFSNLLFLFAFYYVTNWRMTDEGEVYIAMVSCRLPSALCVDLDPPLPVLFF